MKAERGAEMDKSQELNHTGSRRVKTAMWKIPTDDYRRKSFCKSAPGSCSVMEQPETSQQSFTPYCSSSNSYRTSQLSSTSELQCSCSTCPACSTQRKMDLSPVQIDSSSAVTSDLQLDRSRWNNSSQGSVINLENTTPCNVTSTSTLDITGSGFKVGKLPYLSRFTDIPKLVSSADGSLDSSMSQQSMKTMAMAEHSSTDPKVPWYLAVLREKERFMNTLSEEVKRLTNVESECVKKDQVILALNLEVQKLKSQLCPLLADLACKVKENSSQKPADEEHPEPAPEGDALSERLAKDDSRDSLLDLRLKLTQHQMARAVDLEGHKSAGQGLFQESSETLSPCSSEGSSSSGCSGDSGSDTNNKATQTEKDEVLTELHNMQSLNQQLATELEKAKKDYDLCLGVISSQQRQCSFQESLLRKADSDYCRLQKEFKERGLQLQAMSTKFSNLREERKHEEMLAAMEKENFTLRKSIAELNSELEKRNSVIGGQKSEIQKFQAQGAAIREQLKMTESEWEEAQGKADKLDLLESQLRVALEVTNAKFERFRAKILQATFGTNGVKPPPGELTDNEILEAMQKIITDRVDFHQQLAEKGVKVPPLAGGEAPVVQISTKQTAGRKKTLSTSDK